MELPSTFQDTNEKIICSGFVLCIPSDFLTKSHDETMMNRHVLVKSVAFREGGGAGLWCHPRKEAHGGSLHLHHEIRPQGSWESWVYGIYNYIVLYS